MRSNKLSTKLDEKITVKRGRTKGINYRGKQQLVWEILKAILEMNEGTATKTHVMYRAFLSYEQLIKYLGLMVEHKLIEQLDDSVYKITDNGLLYIRRFEGINELLPPTLNHVAQSIAK